MNSGVKVTKDRTAAIKAALKALVQDRVLVGIASEKAFRDPDPEDPTPHLNNAEIGYINEFGAPEANIPARPHLVPGSRKALPKVEKLYRDAAPKALDGDTKAIKDAHGKVGFTVTSSVKNLITDGVAPPLAERTLKDRKRRGRDGETPLLDTGQYRRNIDFVIRPAGQKTQYSISVITSQGSLLEKRSLNRKLAQYEHRKGHPLDVVIQMKSN